MSLCFGTMDPYNAEVANRKEEDKHNNNKDK